ncbi:DUF397 domain-containing protein [Yinghuangia soli]|uniref:DUF397 domain-containing protein n=1 Tax=Yinghuangia soli TaxID=2908204 RepID=A0AA41Q872_9ACTN|nr:DUF397 domain-containing protein [Yinghuangia soli]MCF2533403.1 DUF397 domain-containing protein [Yinghuangia soli]
MTKQHGFAPVGWRKSSYSNGTGGSCVEVAQSWRKSSYSGGSGGNCVEVAGAWRKSSHSGGNGGSCLEVADGNLPLVPVRDSKDVARGFILIPAGSWAELAKALS